MWHRGRDMLNCAILLWELKSVLRSLIGKLFARCDTQGSKVVLQSLCCCGVKVVVEYAYNLGRIKVNENAYLGRETGKTLSVKPM